MSRYIQERIVTTDLATDERDPSDQNPVIVTPRLPTQNDVNVSVSWLCD